MDYREMRTEEILRIGEVDRTESVHAGFEIVGLISKQIVPGLPGDIVMLGHAGGTGGISATGAGG